MAFYVSGKGTFTPAPEGVHNAVCVDLVDMGPVQTRWGMKPKVRLVWELDPETAGTIEDGKQKGKRFIASKRYTPSLHEKAQLHKDLKAWRGRAFTPEELDRFDLEAVLGAPCKLVIQHDEKDGTTYSNIVTIMKADPKHKLIASGDYTRVKDRPTEGPQASNGDGEHADSDDYDGADDPDAIPF
jgi:hypothetical protein